MFKYKQFVTFNDAAIAEEEYEWLYNFVKDNNIKTVLEFGLGASTYCFLENGCKVVTFETSKSYADSFKHFGEDCEVVIYNKNDKIEREFDYKFDLAFVDGPFGTKSLSRLNSCLYSIKNADHVLLHDFRRSGEKETADFITSRYEEWSVETIQTRRHMGYFHKQDRYSIT